MNLKHIKIIFISIIIILILAGTYIIYIKNNKTIDSEEKKIKEIITTKDIIIGITQYDTINPLLTKSLEIQYITKLIYEPLINITKDFDLEPAIAKEWSKIDELTYILKIDGNKEWSSGNKVKIEDIIFTINKIKESDSIYNENVENIQQVEKIDETTLKIHLEKEKAFFEYLLCFPIIEQKTYNLEIPYGTGEYVIDSIEKQQIEISNKERKITIKIYENISELYNNFSKENVDLILTQNVNYGEYLGNIGFNETLITGREFYYISCENIKDIETRHIIEKSINKEKIIYDLYNNRYKVAQTPLDYGSYLNIIEEKNLTIDKKINKTITISTLLEDKKIIQNIEEQLREKEINVQNYQSTQADLILKKQIVPIIPDISIYNDDQGIEEQIIEIMKIENKEILAQEYKKILTKFYEEKPFIPLFFNNYIILSNENLKGDFSGNWYNIFYHIDNWYKII